MLTEVVCLLQPAFSFLKLFGKWFYVMNQYVNVHWGWFSQLVLDLLILYIVFMMVYQLVKLFFRVLFRIVVPAIILAGIVFFFTSYSFLNILPIFLCLFLAINLLRS